MFYSNDIKLQRAKIRLAAVEAKAGRVKHQGVIRKLEREIRKLEEEQ